MKAPQQTHQSLWLLLWPELFVLCGSIKNTSVAHSHIGLQFDKVYNPRDVISNIAFDFLERMTVVALPSPFTEVYVASAYISEEKQPGEHNVFIILYIDTKDSTKHTLKVEFYGNKDHINKLAQSLTSYAVDFFSA